MNASQLYQWHLFSPQSKHKCHHIKTTSRAMCKCLASESASQSVSRSFTNSIINACEIARSGHTISPICLCRPRLKCSKKSKLVGHFVDASFLVSFAITLELCPTINEWYTLDAAALNFCRVFYWMCLAYWPFSRECCSMTTHLHRVFNRKRSSWTK